MKLPSEDVDARTPVWVALGEFFLDNVPNLDYVARVCAESPYSVRELDQILFSEVWPALIANLASIAGEWAGWNREWLVTRVIEKHKSGSARFWWLNPAKLYFCSAWPQVRKDIEKRRTYA